MRKLTFGFAVLFFTVLLAAGLIWAQQGQEAEQGKKAKETQSMMLMRPMMAPNMMGGGRSGMKMQPGRLPEWGDPIKRALSHLRGPDFFALHAEKLDLSEDQVADLKAIRWDHRKSVIKKRADIQIAHVELEELLDQEPVNFEKVKAKIILIGDLEQEMLLAHLSIIQKAHRVLTAEQLKEAKSLRKHPFLRKMGMKSSASSLKKASKIKEIPMEETKK